MKYRESLIVALTLWCTLGPPRTAFASPGSACEVILQDYRDKGIAHFEELRQVVALLKQIDVAVLEGKRQPTFADVDILDKAHELLIKADRFRGNDIYSEIFTKIREQLPLVKARTGEDAEVDPQGDYAPNAFELKTLYQSTWNELAKLLPAQLGAPQLRISYRLSHRAEIEQSGRAIMDHCRQKLGELFSKTSGFPSYEAYLAKLREVAQQKPYVQLLLDMLHNNGMEVIVQRPENGRWWVSKIGLHNQHVTGTSKGYNGKAGRNAVEASYSDLPLEKFATMDDTAKPVYGHMAPSQAYKGKLARSEAANVYGTDGYVLDHEALADRLSFTMGGDSLNRARSFVPNWGHGKASTPSSWDHLFIPWEQRGLAFEMIANERFEYQGTAGTGLKSAAGKGSSYAEIQVHGSGLDRSMIKAFEFANTPPSGAFLRQLRESGIEIRQRVGPGDFKIWEEDVSFEPIQTFKSTTVDPGKPIQISEASIRKVTSTSDPANPGYEWTVDVTVSQDLGPLTNRIKVVDGVHPDTRMNPTVTRVGDGGGAGPFVYRVKMTGVKINQKANLYARLITETGYAYSNEGRPHEYFSFGL